VYLITGAGNGVGRALSLAFAGEGATVVLLDKAVAALEAVYDAIVEEGGAEPAIMALDLEGAQPEDFQKLAEAVESDLGRLDGVIHAAARLGPLSPVEHYTADEWATTLRINLTGPFLLTQPLLPLLAKAPDPTITFVTDAVGAEPQAYWGAYGVSKAGLEAFARILGQETEQAGIRVNTVEPGPVKTGMQQEAFPALDPAGLADPADLAPVFLDLVAPTGNPRNGERLRAADHPGD
jgi:NAD(P)-dependent dehydrogenase (short-subunit alcohol dehydrogenase family)